MPSEAIFCLDVEEATRANFPEIPHAMTSREDRDLERCVDRFLEALEVSGCTGTFFILGTVAKAYPRMVKRIQAAGHEVGSHGWDHQLIYNLSREEFHQQTHDSRCLLEDLVQTPIQSYRAASSSVSRKTPWYAEVLKAENFSISSSLSPMATGLYGDFSMPRAPFRFPCGLVEVPATTIRILQRNVLFASGVFFRWCPMFLLQHWSRRVRNEGLPILLTLHPREVNPATPRLPLSLWKQWIFYGRTRSTLPKLMKLLSSDLPFVPLAQWVAENAETFEVYDPFRALAAKPY